MLGNEDNREGGGSWGYLPKQNHAGFSALGVKASRKKEFFLCCATLRIPEMYVQGGEGVRLSSKGFAGQSR